MELEQRQRAAVPIGQSRPMPTPSSAAGHDALLRSATVTLSVTSEFYKEACW